MPIVIIVKKEIENSSVWKTYKSHKETSITLPSHHAIDLIHAFNNGVEVLKMLINIEQFIDFSHSYSFLLDNHEYTDALPSFQNTKNTTVGQLVNKIETEFGTGLNFIADTYANFVYFDLSGTDINVDIIANNNLKPGCFSIPFIKALLTITPNINASSPVSLSNAIIDNMESTFIQLANKYYDFSHNPTMAGIRGK
ncbi:hypothetical protein SAMN05216480_10659 [Pustulibacterium marinum]|uniref:Uncharacterized protein n=1 Tax=Pustulibacterium marinum TaxID=1224947 RepID=A0A1I7GX22_9FLAO|nr:hypothetical protein [Pustulibacterium marinum]SFU52969.1 hypothetical protein SAMN05216480_10659 [Pustulibacterium marinum]